MIDYFPLRAYLCQIPLSEVISAGKEYTVESTIESYMDRSQGCDYKLSNCIYKNNLCTVYDDPNMTVMISLNDNSLWVDRSQMESVTITDADKWRNKITQISYDKFLDISKACCKEQLNNPQNAGKIREIAKNVKMRSREELLDARESFDFDGMLVPAVEAPEDDITSGLDKLNKISEGEDTGTKQEETKPVAENDGKSPDLTKTTQDQLDADNEGEPDDMLSGGGEDPFGDTAGDDTGGGDDMSTDTGDDAAAKAVENDPMKSVEVKQVYRDRFVRLYDVIEDALTTMESFTPDYNTKISAKYYTIQIDLTHLKEAIYRICTRRLSKMSVPEVLRAYTIANNIFDISTRMMKDFFNEYNGEIDKMNKKSDK